MITACRWQGQSKASAKERGEHGGGRKTKSAQDQKSQHMICWASWVVRKTSGSGCLNGVKLGGLVKKARVFSSDPTGFEKFLQLVHGALVFVMKVLLFRVYVL